MTRAPVLASAAALVALAVAAPAIGGAISSHSGPGGQPPPGAPAVKIDSSARPAYTQQPPAGAGPVKVTGPAPTYTKQPANPNPQPAGKPTTRRIPERKQGLNSPSNHGARTEHHKKADRAGGPQD